jgi:flagellar basal-body rod modification protein FlgD
MSTSPIGTIGSPAVSSTTGKGVEGLGSDDFLKLLITELSQQDPFEPMKNQDLLNQVNTIRSMEMNTNLTDTLKALSLQGSLGSASNLIGKVITGLGVDRNPVTGLVSGVRVSDGKVVLELKDGTTVSMEDVTHVAGAPTANAAVQ